MVFNQGSARCYTNFILLIKLNAVFLQLSYCTGVPRITGMFLWGSAASKRLKTTALNHCVSIDLFLATAEPTRRNFEKDYIKSEACKMVHRWYEKQNDGPGLFMKCI